MGQHPTAYWIRKGKENIAAVTGQQQHPYKCRALPSKLFSWGDEVHEPYRRKELPEEDRSGSPGKHNQEIGSSLCYVMAPVPQPMFGWVCGAV